MVMLHDRAANRALVIDRAGTWSGLSFPGGHLEPGESLEDCARREFREETGLTLAPAPATLVPCGLINWFHREDGARYLAFLYRAENYTGELIPATPEGRVHWMDLDALRAAPSTNGFDKYLPLFFADTWRETHIPWDDANPWGNA